MTSKASALIRFRRMGLFYQAVLAGAVFFAAYDLFIFFAKGMSSSEALSEALLGALIFMSTYYITSALILISKAKRPRSR
ncbi:MAG: hypothetical protein GKC10_03460 [Methanosarcinales archaeon]|nr:hypothetical protein [Methanosarcinales archaeon]